VHWELKPPYRSPDTGAAADRAETEIWKGTFALCWVGLKKSEATKNVERPRHGALPVTKLGGDRIGILQPGSGPERGKCARDSTRRDFGEVKGSVQCDFRCGGPWGLGPPLS